ncbi:MAG: Calx-beta domain-containing protein, partial [Chloroflexota bacterium]
MSITHLTVQHFNYGITTTTGPISNFLVQHVDVVDNVTHGIWSQAFGVTNYTVDDVNASRNNQAGGLAGRGFWMINGVKQNVSVTNSTFDQNGLVGIDLSDGSVTGATITGNTVTNNGDSGIGVLGAIAGGANLVANNTVTNNGRYGIEIKNSTGDGTDTGGGSLTVSGNAVSRSATATDARDYGGIVVIRRSPVLGDGNPNLPTGVVIEGNTVSGFHRKPSGSTGDGFGIVVGGTGHVITKNIVTNNDVGVQVQAGNPSINAQSTVWFDRDDSASGNAGVSRNAITGNGVGMRAAGTVTGTTADCNWWGSASGPGAPGGAGSGDGISTGIPFSSWLLTSNLNGSCPGAIPTVSVGSLSNVEGSGTDPVVNVPVTLSNAYGGTVTVQYATADGSGPTGAVAPSDYTAASGTVTFLGGETSKTIPVTIRGNASPVQYDEKDETFTVVLSSPTNATLGTNPGTVTILNDDTPTVSLGASTISTVEGNAGTHNVQVPVSLTNPSTFPITVHYTTANSSATAPSDYASASGTLTIPANSV